MDASGIITLTTDFGCRDAYVGIMKGVILQINPAARLVDISHEVEQGDVYGAAGLIEDAWDFFPPGTVHLAVVDPGVGTARRPIVAACGGHLFVGPDNGIFHPILAGYETSHVFHLANPDFFLPEMSNTFHGRDVFAPVAAHLSLGVEPERMGPVIGEHVELHVPEPFLDGEVLRGQVIRIDRFGNLVSNISEEDLSRFLGNREAATVLGSVRIEGLSRTYADVSAGEFLALMGSTGRLEISINSGRACERVGMGEGECIGAEVAVYGK